ncbi:MAG: tryptophan--tRNA ligase, partial [Planctomycetota bacterium]
NRLYGETFPEPRGIVPEGAERRIKGLDGNAKMSKSRGNAVSLIEEPDEIRSLMKTAFTDPQRLRLTDPGRPESCNIWTLHHFFTDEARVKAIADDCRSASLGCTDCKRELADNLAGALAPIRERYHQVRSDEDALRGLLADGATRARGLARETLTMVRDRMGLREGGRIA